MKVLLPSPLQHLFKLFIDALMIEKVKVLMQESESFDALTSGASSQTPHRYFNDLESESVGARK